MLSDEGLNSDITQIINRPMPAIQRNFICSSVTFSNDAYSKLTKILNFQWELIRSVLVDKSVIEQNLQGDQKLDTLKDLSNRYFRDSFHLICRAGSFSKRVNTIINFFRSIEF